MFNHDFKSFKNLKFPLGPQICNYWISNKMKGGENMTEMMFVKSVGQNLKFAVKEYGISLTELSAKTHIDKSTLSKYLQGKRIPTLINIVNLAYALECGLEELVDADDYVEI